MGINARIAYIELKMGDLQRQINGKENEYDQVNSTYNDLASMVLIHEYQWDNLNSIDRKRSDIQHDIEVMKEEKNRLKEELDVLIARRNELNASSDEEDT
ncbi:hypothetical protein E2542_SST14787 [Spatholobus suberectus]|nr:hypothetical protein E2542_SST14787 [Spatholobus suberectus]